MLTSDERELIALLRGDPVARNLAHRIAWSALAAVSGLVLVGSVVLLIAGR